MSQSSQSSVHLWKALQYHSSQYKQKAESGGRVKWDEIFKNQRRFSLSRNSSEQHEKVKESGGEEKWNFRRKKGWQFRSTHWFHYSLFRVLSHTTQQAAAAWIPSLIPTRTILSLWSFCFFFGIWIACFFFLLGSSNKRFRAVAEREERRIVNGEWEKRFNDLLLQSWDFLSLASIPVSKESLEREPFLHTRKTKTNKMWECGRARERGEFTGHQRSRGETTTIFRIIKFVMDECKVPLAIRKCCIVRVKESCWSLYIRF